jgi:hypothetical protein
VLSLRQIRFPRIEDGVRCAQTTTASFSSSTAMVALVGKSVSNAALSTKRRSRTAVSWSTANASSSAMRVTGPACGVGLPCRAVVSMSR